MPSEPLDPAPSDPATAARSVLRARLTAVMKQRDRVAAGALRSVLGAIDSAEAVDVAAGSDPAAGAAPLVTSEHVAGAVVGVGATEVGRRSLTDEDIRRIVEQEIEDRRQAVPHYLDAGEREAQRAADLQHEIDTLVAVLPDLGLA